MSSQAHSCCSCAAWQRYRADPPHKRALLLRPSAARQPDAPSTPPPVGRRRLLSSGVAPVLCCTCPACRRRNAAADAAFADAMAGGMFDYEAAIAPTKRALFEQLFAHNPSFSSNSSRSSSDDLPTLLEVGIGTGPNLPYLRRSGRDFRILGVDPNEYMRRHLEAAAARVDWPAGRLSWELGDAEALPLGDASVDAAVCTLVLCSVADPPAVVREVRRVLRPGGRLLFIEHTAAPADASPLLRLGQWAFNPLQQLLADGCHLTRDPLPAIESAGFSSVQARRFSVEGMGLIGPHVAGIATA